MQHNDGLGWDGCIYAKMAQADPLKNFSEKIYSAYYVKRLFSSTVVHYGSRIFGHPLNTPENIVNAFYIYNFIIILFGIFTWFLIAKFYKWSPPLYLISFSALFINYPILKLSMYHPNLTDYSAMIAGLITLYLYLRDKWFLLFIASMISSFVWPTMNYLMIPLLAFKVQNTQLPIFKCTKFSNILSAIIVSVLLVFFFFKRLYIYDKYSFSLLFNTSLLGFFLFLAIRPFVDLNYIFSQLKNDVISYRTTLSRIALSILFFLIVTLCISFSSNNEAGPFKSFSEFYFLFFRIGIHYPLSNIVSHTLYYGPVVLLIIFLWNDFVRTAKETGFGIVLVIIVYVFLHVGPESRQLSSALPVFSILICKVLNDRKVGWNFAFSFFILSLMTSKFWIPHNFGTWIPPTQTTFFEFPVQAYFMNFGPWQSPMMYTVFLGVTIILAICMWALLQLPKQQIVAKNLNNSQIA